MESRQLLELIDNFWDDLVVSAEGDTDTHIGLPHPFVAPSVHRNQGFAFKEQFYWDTYFTILPLVKGKRWRLAKGMVDNLLYLIDLLGYVPNSNNRLHLGRTQPPLLSQMVRLIYDARQDMAWLRKAYDLIEKEYYQVWLGPKRLEASGLSHYFGQNSNPQTAEDESGWDYTTRFDNRANEILPVDLNCFLYLYETDMAEYAEILGYADESLGWQLKSANRRTLINQIMWDDSKGIYKDYDYVNQRPMEKWSLAAYIPLFAGVADREQAKRLRLNLNEFETDFGLTTTPKIDQAALGKQWAAPNGWAPLHLLTVKGLEDYGFKADASRIAKKWVGMVMGRYESDGVFYEKYNMIDPRSNPVSAVYPDQEGFAWTNAVTEVFISDYLD